MKGRKAQFNEDQVRRMREAKEEGLSSRDIAKALRVSSGTILEYLSGRRQPRKNGAIRERRD
jgi:hypothetical protein